MEGPSGPRTHSHRLGHEARAGGKDSPRATRLGLEARAGGKDSPRARAGGKDSPRASSSSGDNAHAIVASSSPKASSVSSSPAAASSSSKDLRDLPGGSLSSLHPLAILSVLVLASLPILASLASSASPDVLAPLLAFHVGVPHPSACQTPSKPPKAAASALPLLVFVAGVEGSGHDYFTNFFSLLKDREINVTVESYDPDVYVTSSADQVAYVGGRKTSGACPRLQYSRQVYDFGAEVTSRLASLQEAPGVPFRGVYVRSRDTVPSGALGTPLARPDLVALSMFHGIIYRLKVLVLVRSPDSIMGERIRNKTYSQDPGLLFRVTEDSLTYLDASVRQLPCGVYATVNMDTLLTSEAEEADVASQLASFLEIQGLGSSDALETMRQSRSLYLIPGGSSSRGRRLAQEESSPSTGNLDQQASPSLRGSLAADGVGRREAQGRREAEGRRRLLAEESAQAGLEGNSEEEIQAWRKEMGDKTSLRRLLWPLSAAAADVPFFSPKWPSDWPVLTS